jgi:hypothetical protein
MRGSTLATYNYITLSQASQQLANRLYDSSMVFWGAAELVLYIQEALRTWNAMTGYWRGDFVFPSQSGVIWYDLTDQPNTLIPYTITDAYLYQIIQYHLLEPATGVNPWSGVSNQFTANDLISAVQRRRDEILSVTGCTINVRMVPAIAGRTQLPDTVIDVRRLAYWPVGGATPASLASVVWPDDEWSERSFNGSYTINPPGTPQTYLMTTQPPIAFDTDAPPALPGEYEVLTVEAGPLLVAATPQTLMVPDDWTHVIKWGALADLLNRESEAKDQLRAKYCEQRYRMGLQLLMSSPSILAARIGNVAIQVDAVRTNDEFNTSWESLGPGTPTMALQSGSNLIALSPTPDAGNYSVTATVVENAPVPVALGDSVQVARDDLDVIIDYAQHLASFKMGGAEFTSTMPLLERFMSKAAVYGLKLTEIAEYDALITGVSQQEENLNPRMAPAPASMSTPAGGAS